MPDVVGIGAVNVDYIVLDNFSTNPAGGHNNRLDEVFDSIEPGSERTATPAEIVQALEAISDYESIASVGGSSLNTLASIAATGAEVTVGLVGVRGQSGADRLSLRSWFASLRIDDRHIFDSDDLAGVCISRTNNGERTLLTSPGANRSVLKYLIRNKQAIVSYLCEAKVVLVTSFAGLADMSPLLDILSEVKRVSPSTLLCSDPGAQWTNSPVPVGVDSMLELSDWLFLNQTEFDFYTNRTDRDLYHAKATSNRPMAPTSPAIVLKRPDRVEIFADSESGFEHRIFQNPVQLRADQIVDDTGTGDAFAAGLLVSFASPSISTSDGVDLGFRLASEKLRWPGLGGLDRYSDIYENYV